MPGNRLTAARSPQSEQAERGNAGYRASRETHADNTGPAMPPTADADADTGRLQPQAGMREIDNPPTDPLPRILADHQASPALAPLAATLPDGTPHEDPFLAGRGWQAQGGVYVRQPQAEPEAG